jgi:hypothetical protein
MNPWSAFRSSDYGYGKLQILNATHLNWKQISDETGEVIDEINIIKNAPRSSLSNTVTWDMEEESVDVRAQKQHRQFQNFEKCTKRGASLPACAVHETATVLDALL